MIPDIPLNLRRRKSMCPFVMFVKRCEFNEFCSQDSYNVWRALELYGHVVSFQTEAENSSFDRMYGRNVLSMYSFLPFITNFMHAKHNSYRKISQSWLFYENDISQPSKTVPFYIWQLQFVCSSVLQSHEILRLEPFCRREIFIIWLAISF